MSGFTPEEERRVFDAVDRHKDIDGTNSAMIGLLALKEPGYIPCTAEGIVELLKRSGIPVKGRHCVIIGRGPTAGMPSMLALLNAGNATVTCCHRGTPREVLLPLVDQAEIVVIAVREQDLITKDMVGRGVTVIVARPKVLDHRRWGQNVGWRSVGWGSRPGSSQPTVTYGK